MVQITRIVTAGTDGVSSTWQSVQAQPSWLARAVATVLLIVIGVPLVALLLLVGLVALGFIVVLLLFRVASRRLREAFRREPRRVNVRVRMPEED